MENDDQLYLETKHFAGEYLRQKKNNELMFNSQLKTINKRFFALKFYIAFNLKSWKTGTFRVLVTHMSLNSSENSNASFFKSATSKKFEYKIGKDRDKSALFSWYILQKNSWRFYKVSLQLRPDLLKKN